MTARSPGPAPRWEPTIEWVGDLPGHVRLIDQTLLPERFVQIDCRRVETLWEAIRTLRVRGAPAIGAAGALGVVLALRRTRARTWRDLEKELARVVAYLGSSRPTAVNLFWALKRMERTARACASRPVPEILRTLLAEARAIVEEDRRTCREMAEHGARLFSKRETVLTHCNAGALATVDYGTALGVIFRAAERGKVARVYADETRPLLQGARLTAWELLRARIPVTVICDSMAAQVMREGKIDRVIVGADRIAANGDTANKIGTYGVATLAKAHGVPFFVAAPVSTIDFDCPDGSRIPIEERHPDEVRRPKGTVFAPEAADVYNPAFDVTPARLIAGIITERGVMRAPYRASIAKLRKTVSPQRARSTQRES